MILFSIVIFRYITKEMAMRRSTLFGLLIYLICGLCSAGDLPSDSPFPIASGNLLVSTYSGLTKNSILDHDHITHVSYYHIEILIL